ncbi:MAG TPA: hypothetical protein VGR18_02665 [Rubrobacter sp.]|nr:hypothetical protein [Rubrobacter sp.]
MEPVAADPAFSPDGSEIAAEYHGDIFVVPSGGGMSRVLLPGASDTDKRYPGQELDPAWSPDGTKIIFEHNGNVAGSAYGIYVANADGSSTQAVQVTAKTGEVDLDWQSNSAPTIGGVRPSAGSETRDRTPTIAATVGDKQTNLAKANVTLSLDGNAVPRKAFSYDRATDRLSYTPASNLSFGRHDVQVVARDEMGLRAAKSWSFKVVR